MYIPSPLEKLVNPITKSIERSRLLRIGDQAINLQAGSFVAPRLIGSKRSDIWRAVVTVDEYAQSYSIVTTETSRDTYVKTSIEIAQSANYDRDEPVVTAVRMAYRDGLDSPEQSSFPPSAEDTNGAHLHAGKVLHAIHRVLEVQQKPAFLLPVTQ